MCDWWHDEHLSIMIHCVDVLYFSVCGCISSNESIQEAKVEKWIKKPVFCHKYIVIILVLA